MGIQSLSNRFKNLKISKKHRSSINEKPFESEIKFRNKNMGNHNHKIKSNLINTRFSEDFDESVMMGDHSLYNEYRNFDYAVGNKLTFKKKLSKSEEKLLFDQVL